MIMLLDQLLLGFLSNAELKIPFPERDRKKLVCHTVHISILISDVAHGDNLHDVDPGMYSSVPSACWVVCLLRLCPWTLLALPLAFRLVP